MSAEAAERTARRPRLDADVGTTGNRRQCFERPDVARPRQDDLGAEQGQESVSRGSEADASLREVLQAREGDDALARALGDERRKVVERGDIGKLVQDEQERRGTGHPIKQARVGRGADVAKHPGDERREVVLVLGGRSNIERRVSGDEALRIEGVAIGAGDRRLGSESRQHA